MKVSKKMDTKFNTEFNYTWFDVAHSKLLKKAVMDALVPFICNPFTRQQRIAGFSKGMISCKCISLYHK